VPSSPKKPASRLTVAAPLAGGCQRCLARSGAARH
jgi:hypothetical protein